MVGPQADYAMEHVVYDMNKIAVEPAVDAAKEITAMEPNRPRLVAGAIGPTNRTLSISPSVEDPGFRNCTWDEVVAAYKTQVKGPIGCSSRTTPPFITHESAIHQALIGYSSSTNRLFIKHESAINQAQIGY